MTTKIIRGDCRDVLSSLPADSVHCCVVSPPYWGLRSYLPDGHQNKPLELGLETTPAEYVANMVSVFQEVRRVLRADGTLWLNLGDSYATGAGKVGDCPGGGEQGERWKGKRQVAQTKNPNANLPVGPIIQPNRMPQVGLKPKDLCGIPWRVAFALQADGWWLRSEIIWNKSNPMPESVTDRPTKSHEQVFLLTKSGASTFWTHRDLSGSRVQPEPDYRWVHKETGEESASPQDAAKWRRINLWRGHDYFFDQEAVKEHGTGSDPGNVAQHKNDDGTTLNRTKAGLHAVTATTSRNLRSVWTIATEPFTGSHFAVFPSALAERCIKAGTSERGCCPKCWAPWVRVVERFIPVDPGRGESKLRDASGLSARAESTAKGQLGGNYQKQLDANPPKTVGFRPSCDCPPAAPVPCTVLDPFSGAGTTGLVADRLGRDAILIELNEDYADMAARRLRVDAGMFASVDLVHADEPMVSAITE